MSNWQTIEQERIYEIFPEARFEETEEGYLVIHTNFYLYEGHATAPRDDGFNGLVSSHGEVLPSEEEYV